MKAPDPGLRELLGLSLLADWRLVFLRCRRATFCSPLSLASPVQWRLSRQYGARGEMIEGAGRSKVTSRLTNHSRRQLLANACIAASRVAAYP